MNAIGSVCFFISKINFKAKNLPTKMIKGLVFLCKLWELFAYHGSVWDTKDVGQMRNEFHYMCVPNILKQLYLLIFITLKISGVAQSAE